MVQASATLNCIFVDCDWGKKNREISDRYGVTGYPTVVFCDPDGKAITRLDAEDPASVAKQILEISGKYNSKPDSRIPVPQIIGKSVEEALALSRRSSQPVLLYFSDDSPGSTAVSLALADADLKAMLSRFVFAKAEFRKGSDDCTRFDVTRAPTLLVLDGSAQKPEEKPLARITGSRSVRELQRELESALPAGSAAPAATTPDAAKPVPTPRPFEERLSDDEVERRFIQARVAVAMDMVKRGKKDKAIEVFEDILKSYPKHVDTQIVRKLLEETRK